MAPSLPGFPNNTPLARFLKYSSWFSKTKNIVKPDAFIPPTNGKFSVVRIDGLQKEEVFETGKKQLSPNIYGFAEFLKQSILDTGLTIDNDNVPPRHCTIYGWPSEKDARKELAFKLAEKCNPPRLCR